MNRVDRQIIELYRPKGVVILPTAAGREADFYKWIEMGVDHFAKLGVKAVGLPVINIIKAFEEDVEPLWVEGLGLIDWAVLPHFDWALRHDEKKVMGFIKNAESEVKKIVGIDEETAVVVRGEEVEVLGRGKMHIFETGSI
jgi:peptidase E